MKQRRTMFILAIVLVGLLLLYGVMSLLGRRAEEAENPVITLTEIESPTAFGYSSAEGSMSYTQKDETWTYDADADIPMQQSVVGLIAEDIGHLSAVRELGNPDALEDYGLTEPSYSLWITEKGTTTTISIGGETGENYYATVDDTGDVYTIAGDILSELYFDLSDIVQLDSVPTISSGNLQKVTVKEAGRTTEYTEEEDLDELAGGFGAVSLSTAVDYHATAESLADYGLDTDSRITATATYTDPDTEEETTWTLYIGEDDGSGENQYVTPKNSNIVYTVGTAVIKNMITTD